MENRKVLVIGKPENLPLAKVLAFVHLAQDKVHVVPVKTKLDPTLYLSTILTPTKNAVIPTELNKKSNGLKRR
jgi:hypothetical protein